MLDFYQLDFTSDLPAKTLPGGFHKKSYRIHIPKQYAFKLLLGTVIPILRKKMIIYM